MSEDGKPKKTKANPNVISMWEHMGWGNTIFFTDWDKRMVAGFLTPIPQKGDILRCKMKSGKIAKFRFETVDAMTDPKDQFLQHYQTWTMNNHPTATMLGF